MDRARINTLRVLVIDDDRFVRDTIHTILRHIGITLVFDAADATTGMKEALHCEPDVIFCDIHMPEGDGISFLSSLRRNVNSAIAKTPVIMLTSDRTPDAVKAAKDLKISGYVLKPVSLGSVTRALDRALKELQSDE